MIYTIADKAPCLNTEQVCANLISYSSYHVDNKIYDAKKQSGCLL
jgi:hypothetical protein